MTQVSKQNDKLRQNHNYMFACWLRRGVICRIHSGYRTPENVGTIRNKFAVILNALKPPPHGVTAIEPCMSALTKQVGNEAMSQSTSKCQNYVPETKGKTEEYIKLCV